MQDYEHDSPSSIIPLSNKNNSGRLHAPEHVGPQVRSRHSTIGRKLNRRPVLGSDQGFVAQPLGDGLLTERRTVHKLGDTFRERRLAARDLDSAPQGGNVVLLHKHRGYTTSVVGVNNIRGVPKEEGVCTVLNMPRTQQKTAVPPEADAQINRDSQGRTLGDRIALAMQVKSRKLGHKYLQKDLLADTNKAAGRGKDDEPIITQQGLSLLMQNRRSESTVTPALAVALEVEALWLQYGVGPASYMESLTATK